MMRRTTLLTLAVLVLGAATANADRKLPRKDGPREVAILGAGCFWGVEHWMLKLDGIASIDVGYAGGASDQVKYEQVTTGKTGHAEAVRIVYDPGVISYELLLNYFFRMHDPTTANAQGNDIGPQYRSAIFPQNDAQKKIAEQMRARVAKSNAWKKPLSTTIEPNAKWVRAEEYHQDYLVKNPNGYDNHYLRVLDF
jgi:methionine-S-sulfoxide reductase